MTFLILVNTVYVWVLLIEIRNLPEEVLESLAKGILKNAVSVAMTVVSAAEILEDQECTRLSATNVGKNVKFDFVQSVTDLFFAARVLTNKETRSPTDRLKKNTANRLLAAEKTAILNRTCQTTKTWKL